MFFWGTMGDIMNMSNSDEKKSKLCSHFYRESLTAERG